MDLIEIVKKELKDNLQTNESLALHTSFRIGGPAKYFYNAKTSLAIKKIVKIAKNYKIPYFILGRGSNILISDQGFNGLIIHNQACRVNVNQEKIFADSGINLSKLANVAKENSLTGLEFAAGIPGTLGGAIWGNAGSFGKEMKDIIEKVEIMTEEGELYTRMNQKCEFSYRNSIFKRNKEIILSAILLLKISDKSTIKNKMNEFINKKRATQDLAMPSAGCVFKNPKIDYSKEELKSKHLDPTKVKDGKIPAAYLIDELGLKEYKIGQAMVSQVHANFIINLGGATAENVMILIGIIKQKVRDAFNIQLQEEIQIIGFDKIK